MKKTLDILMERTEESLKEYAKKQDWTPQDLECAKTAASLYDKLQSISMNMGIWEQMNDGSDHDANRSYAARHMMGGRSFARGRDAATGRYTSRGRYYDDRMSYDDGYDEYSGGRRGGRSYASDNRSMHGVNDKMVQKLEGLLNENITEQERQAVMEMIDHIEGKS